LSTHDHVCSNVKARWSFVTERSVCLIGAAMQFSWAFSILHKPIFRCFWCNPTLLYNYFAPHKVSFLLHRASESYFGKPNVHVFLADMPAASYKLRCKSTIVSFTQRRPRLAWAKSLRYWCNHVTLSCAWKLLSAPGIQQRNRRQIPPITSAIHNRTGCYIHQQVVTRVHTSLSPTVNQLSGFGVIQTKIYILTTTCLLFAQPSFDFLTLEMTSFAAER